MTPILSDVDLTELRALEAEEMVDQFTAFAATWAPVDGLRKQMWTEQDVTVGLVSGRAREGDPNTRTVTIGNVEHLIIEGGLKIPLSAELPQIGWEYVCTWADNASDPALLGRRWRVVDVPVKSRATARRLDVVEV